MKNLEELTDEQLRQRIRDAEDDVFRARMELSARIEKSELGRGMRRAFADLFAQPSMMERNRIFFSPPKFVGKMPERKDIPVGPPKMVRWRVELEIYVDETWDQATVNQSILSKLNDGDFLDIAEIVDSCPLWKEE